MDSMHTTWDTTEPCHPEFKALQPRLESFVEWPTHVAQKPGDLAEAGFFYIGPDDTVKCFFCDGGLRNWEHDDDPWEEHARWFPDCPNLIQMKGTDYVREVQGTLWTQSQGLQCNAGRHAVHALRHSLDHHGAVGGSSRRNEPSTALPQYKMLIDPGDRLPTGTDTAIPQMVASVMPDLQSPNNLTGDSPDLDNLRSELEKDFFEHDGGM